MKKNYIKPELRVVRMAKTSLLAGSPSYTDTPGDPTKPVKSKKSSMYDDYDFQEED